jgi:hypothetical protein
MTDWQFSFTEGLNPIMTSLLISEAKCEKIKNSKAINIGILDVQSAFDLDQHKILLSKLIDTDFPVLTTSLVKRFYINVWIGFLPALHFVRWQSFLLVHLPTKLD